MATSSAASFERTGDTGDLSNKLDLVDKKNTKSDIWKYFALRFNVIFISIKDSIISMPNYNLKTQYTVIQQYHIGNIRTYVLKLIFFDTTQRYVCT